MFLYQFILDKEVSFLKQIIFQIFEFYKKNSLKSNADKGKKNYCLLTVCQHASLFLHPYEKVVPL